MVYVDNGGRRAWGIYSDSSREQSREPYRLGTGGILDWWSSVLYGSRLSMSVSNTHGLCIRFLS